jgi:putative DNA-invertase from lambdoid prophage Rac
MILGYIRVSSESSVDGESLKVQRRQLQGWALQHGKYISKIFADEGVSGSIPLQERPQGRLLVERLRPGDVVVASKLDRAFRSVIDALETLRRFEQGKVDLVLLDMGGSVLHDGISKFIFTLLSAFADFERSRIALRIREAKQQQKQRGDYLGGPAPFGWRVVNRCYVPDPEQQRAITDIFAMRSRGLSYHRIASALRERGVSISHMTVKNVLDGKVKALDRSS